MQGYIFLLLRSNPSLLGLGYLALCIAIFLNPPLRGEFEERDEMGRVVEGPESTVSNIYRGSWSLPGEHDGSDYIFAYRYHIYMVLISRSMLRCHGLSLLMATFALLAVPMASSVLPCRSTSLYHHGGGQEITLATPSAFGLLCGCGICYPVPLHCHKFC